MKPCFSFGEKSVSNFPKKNLLQGHDLDERS